MGSFGVLCRNRKSKRNWQTSHSCTVYTQLILFVSSSHFAFPRLSMASPATPLIIFPAELALIVSISSSSLCPSSIMFPRKEKISPLIEVKITVPVLQQGDWREILVSLNTQIIVLFLSPFHLKHVYTFQVLKI